MPEHSEITHEKIDSMCWKSLVKTIKSLKKNSTTYEIGETIENIAYPIEETIIRKIKENDIAIVLEKSNKDEKWECLMGLMEKERAENPSVFKTALEDFYILMKKIEKIYSQRGILD